MQINKLLQLSVGADLSRTPPIYRPFAGCSALPMNLLTLIIDPPCPIDYPGYKLRHGSNELDIPHHQQGPALLS